MEGTSFTSRVSLLWMAHRGTIRAGAQMGPLEDELEEEVPLEEDKEEDIFIFCSEEKIKMKKLPLLRILKKKIIEEVEDFSQRTRIYVQK